MPHNFITNAGERALRGRKALDEVVFDALGLTEEERKEVCRAARDQTAALTKE